MIKQKQKSFIFKNKKQKIMSAHGFLVIIIDFALANENDNRQEVKRFMLLLPPKKTLNKPCAAI
ncbi:hypothetical protein DW155_08055 [Lactococcus petauri]|nr:hypothetical protein [Lactococcus petauri]NHI69419.1 hypothetical protein [Lactococcus garvieae]NHI71686.1 hypothetical protein [Lactococcus petauri]NHI79493.1 hypothetical protein [Lactococcus petauri]NHJ06426.1 hypothetical protein [Lactococcus garvieae]